MEFQYKDVRRTGFKSRMQLKQAIEAFLGNTKKFSGETIDITQNSINNRILLEDIYAERTIPPFDRSAVDGYALIAEDTYGASETNPIRLKIIGEMLIGEEPEIQLNKGTCVEITTGAIIPQGATAVIMYENTTKISKNQIEIYTAVPENKNIAPAGEDFKKGDILFKQGHRCRYLDRGYLLLSGVKSIKVAKQLKIAIYATGDELVEPWQNLEVGQIPEINTTNLTELCQKEGWNTVNKGILPDHYDTIKNELEQSSKRFDVILVSGGTSVGQKDYVPIIIKELGEIFFHGLAIRPASPVLGGIINKTLIFGLPGFPTASIISYLFVVRPILLKLCHLDKTELLTMPALLSRNISSKLGRRDFLRIKLIKEENSLPKVPKYTAVPLEIKGSGRLGSLISADGIIVIPENSEGYKKGSVVDVIPLSLLLN